jgi:hypothetical protein
MTARFLDLLFPRFPLRQLPAMLEIAATGAIIAGLYGMVHDQISYSISSEYFTAMKFQQFPKTDFGLPNRVRTSIIGFLATWWVGLFGGWILARYGLAGLPPAVRRKWTIQAFAMVVAGTALVGAAGDLGGWNDYQFVYDLHDVRGFVVVAYLHLAGYLGAAVSILIAVFFVRRWARIDARLIAPTKSG